MPVWFISAGLKLALKVLEMIFPGLKPVIETILEILGTGMPIEEIHAHLKKLKKPNSA